MINLEELFIRETDVYTECKNWYDEYTEKYNDYYVEWLEEKLEDLLNEKENSHHYLNRLENAEICPKCKKKMLIAKLSGVECLNKKCDYWGCL